MNTRLSLLTRRISAIEKDFSKREIESAVKLLEQREAESPLLPYLSTVKRGKGRAKSRRRKKPIQDQKSRSVMRLQHKDPDKYRVLSKFDSLLREARVLPRVNDIRRLGESLTKDFAARSSRRDYISKLMDILATRPLHEITTVMEEVLSTDTGDTGKSDYERLADFIITGKSHHKHTEVESRPS
jgi:hypothetical protein